MSKLVIFYIDQAQKRPLAVMAYQIGVFFELYNLFVFHRLV